MEKYIRTEEGHIYEYVEQRIYPNQYVKFGIYRHNLNSKYEQIIAQSENLAELCDGFVLVEKMREVTYHHKSSKFDDFKSIAMLDERYTLYGAIWTDKGLIYVAKLNADGNLELL